MTSYDISNLIKKAETVLTQLQAWLPPAPPETDWAATAFRWRSQGANGWLDAVKNIAKIDTADLHHVEQQKEVIERNTLHFIQGKPANNILMTGARGTGKSSLVKAMLSQYADQGLRLIEVDKNDLHALDYIVDQISQRPERFIIFCDDLSFEDGDEGYKSLKSVLDGSISATSENILIYATSNRRHLMPEYHNENTQGIQGSGGEIHPGEAVEEKISLSERFGIWLSFYPFSQDDYLSIVNYWLSYHGCSDEVIAASKTEALQWALQRGSRSGRVARQFARDWAAQHG